MNRQAMLISADADLSQTILNLTADFKIDFLHMKSLRDAHLMLRHNVALLIIDLSLDDLRLIDFIKKTRTMEGFQETPILVIADIDQPDRLREALTAGANRYITRGFVNGNLRETLRALDSLAS